MACALVPAEFKLTNGRAGGVGREEERPHSQVLCGLPALCAEKCAPEPEVSTWGCGPPGTTCQRFHEAFTPSPGRRGSRRARLLRASRTQPRRAFHFCFFPELPSTLYSESWLAGLASEAGDLGRAAGRAQGGRRAAQGGDWGRLPGLSSPRPPARSLAAGARHMEAAEELTPGLEPGRSA